MLPFFFGGGRCILTLELTKNALGSLIITNVAKHAYTYTNTHGNTRFRQFADRDRSPEGQRLLRFVLNVPLVLINIAIFFFDQWGTLFVFF